MYTFALVQGDLVLGQGSFATVTGSPKVTQDLTVATLEPFGCDRFHPGWGSILGNMIGTPTTPMTSQAVYAEINRLVGNYIATQAAVQNVYANNGQANPYSAADLVTGIGSYTISDETTTVAADISITTMTSTTSLNVVTGGSQ